MSKIVIDGRWIKQTGIGRYVENTLRQILAFDQQNQYILLVRDEDRAKLELQAPNLTLQSANYNWYSAAEQTKLPKLLDQLSPDLVHFTNFNFPLRYRGKFIITIHDLTLLKFKNINRKKLNPAIYHIKDLVMRRVLDAATKKSVAVITPTEYVAGQIRQTFDVPNRRIFVTPEAADPLIARPAVNSLKLGISKPFLLYVGNAYPHKNLERLILAFGRLVTEHLVDYQLVIAGKKDAFHDRLEREVHDANLDDRVIFTGFVSDAELAGLYKKAKLYVFPSLSEGFGLPPLEAMIYDLPVVCSNATCLPEVLGDAAEFFNPRDIENMSDVIAHLLADEQRQRELIELGAQQVKKYSWASTARATFEVYEQALRARPRK